MGEVLKLHRNVRGQFGMVEQYQKHANHNSTVHNVHVYHLKLLVQIDWQGHVCRLRTGRSVLILNPGLI